jgi:DNA-directed RNA polymerase specialized sigma24 family protein
VDYDRIKQYLELYSSRDEQRQLAGFNGLKKESERLLLWYVTHDLRAGADAEDCVVSAFKKVWDGRSRFENRGVGSWFKYLRETAKHLVIDRVRGEKPETGLEDSPEPADAEDPETRALLKCLSDAQKQRLYDLANTALLALDRQLSTETHHRQLLAAQLYYLDGVTDITELLRLLGPGPRTEAPLNAERLAAWLRDPGALRYLAFIELYYSGDDLAGHLLGMAKSEETEGEKASALDRFMRQAAAPPGEPPPGGRSWPEVAYILWRYRLGETDRSFLTRPECAYTAEELAALHVRLRQDFPFDRVMTDLLWKIQPACGQTAIAALKRAGLWQRLFLQYLAAEALPYGDIAERLKPAADQIDYPIDSRNLPIWFQRIVKYLQEALEAQSQERDDDE